ncbi:MAG: hypothetical protein WCJ39_06460 [bacterium]
MYRTSAPHTWLQYFSIKPDFIYYPLQMEKDLQDFIDQYPEFENCTIVTLDDNKSSGDKGLTRVFADFDLDSLNSLNEK